MSVTSLLLVGEAPGTHVGHDPDRHALYPYPPGCAGARLAILMGMGYREYRRLDRMNLVPHHPGPRTSMKEARHHAEEHLRRGTFLNRSLLIVGAVPARALGLVSYPHFSWRASAARDFEFALVPHTSGRSRVWNDDEVRTRGEAFLRWTAGKAREGCRDFSDEWGRRHV